MTDKQRLELYSQALRIRKIEEAIADLYPEQEMRCPVHLSIGQEVAAVAVCSNLKRSDYVFSNHRCHGHYLAKGGDLKGMIAEIYGKAAGCCGGFGGSMHLIDEAAGFMGAVPIVAGTIPLAVGAAFKFKMKNEKRVSVAFFGDAAIEEGVFHEAANFASLHKLPVLFVCENNLYAVYTPLRERQPEHELCGLARAHGIPSERLRENDLFDLGARVGAAVEKVRAGEGPGFVEILTYRWREHCGPNFDNDLGYRTCEEYESWKGKDPLEKTAGILRAAGVLNPGAEEKLDKKIKAEIGLAVKFAKAAPFPSKKDLDKRLYA